MNEAAVDLTSLTYCPDETQAMVADMLASLLGDLPARAPIAEVDASLAAQGLGEGLAPDAEFGLGAIDLGCQIASALGAAGQLSSWPLGLMPVALALAEMGERAPALAQLQRDIAGGQNKVTLALHEGEGQPPLWPESRLMREAGALHLGLAKHLIPMAQTADHVLAAVQDGQGLAWVMIARQQLTSGCQDGILIDRLPVTDVVISRLEISENQVLLTGTAAEAFQTRVIAAAQILTLAQCLGAMGVMVAQTRDYLGTRRQFGQSLSSYQALRHRFVDMEIALAKSVSMLGAVQANWRSDCRKGLLQASYIIGKSARLIAQEAIQMHGGVGMADETPISLHFRQVMRLSHWFGDEDCILTELTRLAA